MHKKFLLPKLKIFKKTTRFHKVQKLTFSRLHPVFVPVATFFGLLILTLIGYLFFTHNHVQASDTRIVIISHDHLQQTIPTKEPTVGALLKKLDITLNQGDVVEPNADTPIDQDDFRVNVYRAVPVEIVDGTSNSFTFSAATTPRSIATQAGTTVYPEDDISTVPTTNFLQDDAIGERVVINRATPVDVNLYGTPIAMRTQAKTVGALLDEKGIKLAPGDSVTPVQATPITQNQQILIARKGTKLQSVTQPIPMPVQTVDDPSLAYGTSAIRQAGSPGQKVTTYQINLQNGVPVSKTVIQTVIVTQPVTQIEVVGTSLSGIKGDMALAGISPSDYQYADYIISNESGWCPTKWQGEYGSCPAYHGTPGPGLGYGLCQATPGDKMSSAGADWATNPITQLEWCNGYAVRTYGGWSGAYSHWVAYHSW